MPGQAAAEEEDGRADKRRLEVAVSHEERGPVLSLALLGKHGLLLAGVGTKCAVHSHSHALALTLMGCVGAVERRPAKRATRERPAVTPHATRPLLQTCSNLL